MGGVVKAVKKAVTSLFGGPELPGVPKPPGIAPTPDDNKARRRTQREMDRRRRGRVSTVLDEDRLG